MSDTSDQGPLRDLSMLGASYSPLALIERERHVLSQIAAGVPLRNVLDELLRAVESQSGNTMRTSVLVLSEDGRFLQHGAGPSLPAAYNEAVDGIAIAEGVGSCGTAAARQAPVYVDDIANDPLWKDFAALAVGHSLRSCWSMPIKAADGMVLGTFAIYYDEPRAPTAGDIDAIKVIAQTTALAIDRHRSDRSLLRSQETLRLLNADLERLVEERAAVLQARTLERDRAWNLSQEILAVLTADGTLDSVNARWTQQLGWEEAELIGTRVFDYAHPDDLDASLIAFSNIARAPLDSPYEYRLRHKDGSYRWFSWTGSPADGKIYAAGRHVTAERAQAEALRQSQKMEAVGQLTGGVAHDFNNLLTVIRSSTDLLKRPSLSDERRARYVTAISDTVDRAAKLTAQLLAFARRQALKPEVFAACDGVRSIAEMMGTLTGARIEIITDLPEQACLVNADPSQFDTALVNMAVNARDAMNGEGSLTIKVAPVQGTPTVRNHAAVAGPFVAISITDTGSGIAAERLDHVFEPFYTTKDVGHGTGLGLSQVLGFAKQSGGDVTVTSGAGEGTTFVLYLPRVATMPRSEPVQPPQEASEQGHGLRVLVVEDNADVGSFAALALSELGYVTVLAVNAHDALLELGEGQTFDVVFSDVVMPGMSGIELGHEIRRQYPALPVVLTSGYSHVLAQNGTQGFELLQKPYSIDQLSRILRETVGR